MTETLRHEHQCLRCGRPFSSRSETPDYCPLCMSYYWDTPASGVRSRKFERRAKDSDEDDDT